MNPNPTIDAMSEDERRDFFRVLRRMAGVEVTVNHPTDDFPPVFYDAAILADMQGFTITTHDEFGRVALVHTRVGEYEFWQDVYGTHEQDWGGWRFTIPLP